MLRLGNTICFSCLGLLYVWAQDTIRLVNPSFENTPKRRINDLRADYRSPKIKAWDDCGQIYFPDASPHDLPANSTNFWDIKSPGVLAGSTFLGMTVREDGSFEAVSQELEHSLEAGQTYCFSIYLA